MEHELGPIVILGAAQYDGRPSKVLQARLNAALALGTDRHFVTTGSNMPGDRFTEAGVAARYLEARGATHITALREGHTTGEELDAVKRAFPDVKDITLVTDPYHAPRAWLIARRHGFRATTVTATDCPIHFPQASWFRCVIHEVGGILALVIPGLTPALHRLERIMRPNWSARHDQLERE